MDNTLFLIFLALLGGAGLGINRAFLGRLGVDIGAAGASLVNHIGGAIFILVILLLTHGRIDFKLFTDAPAYAYVGGAIGALFVLIISWVISRAGVMKTTVLLISGQMLLGTALDFFLGRLVSFKVAALGLFLILIGVIIGEYQKNKAAK